FTVVQGGCQLFISNIIFKLTRWISITYFKIFHRIEFHGSENVPATGPVIMAANHISYYDPIVVGTGINRDIEFMAWDKLFTIPILRRVIRFFGAFPVESSRADKSAYVNALRTLFKRKALIIFPEGERSGDGKVKNLKLGIARIAFKTNARIVPVTIVGGYKAWPKHRLLPRPKKITVYYHKPITIDKHKFVDIKARNEFFNKVTNQVTKVISSKL
ncbi:MAG: putative 1-acyl-sn-glycerol-3-phosphate acyltransferase, partial [Candidatus Scalindua rubra]